MDQRESAHCWCADIPSLPPSYLAGINSRAGVLAQSAILRVTLGARGSVLGGRWISIHLDHGLPRPEPSNASARLMTSLSRQDFPDDHFTIGPRGFIHP